MTASVLVTGGTGLIGTWLSRQELGEDLSMVTVRGSDFNLLVPGAPSTLIKTFRPQAVVHLAWCASGDADYRHSHDNWRWVDATAELYQVCRENNVPLWATGTGAEAQAGAEDAYTRSKALLRTRLSPEIERQEIGWLRPFYVFDEQVGRPALFADAQRAREFDEILALREPDAEHDFIHAQDVAAAIVVALQQALMGEVQIGSGRTHRVSDCADALGVTWTSTRTSIAERAHMHEAADVSRLTRLGWSPTRTLEFFQ